VLSLIQSSYLGTRTLSEFAREVVDIVNLAVSVPVAFAEGFVKSFLSIESIVEDESGQVTIRPRSDATEQDLFREVDELTAVIEPSAIYNPVVRQRLDRVAEATQEVMRQDLKQMAELSPEELRSALEALEVETAPDAERIAREAEEVRRRLEQIRAAIRSHQARRPPEYPSRPSP